MATINTPPALNVKSIDIKLIKTGHNYRTVMDQVALEELASAMKENGQLQAVGVTSNPDGTYDLNYGFRRVEAAKLLGWSTIKAEIGEKANAVVHRFNNLTENMARENLTTYDQAMAFHDLKQNYKVSGSEIARKAGKNVSYVNNLIRVVESLEPIILERWKLEQSPTFGKDKDGKRIPTTNQICTTDWLIKLCSVPRSEQESHLKQAMGLNEPNPDGEKEGSERGPAGGTTVRRASMGSLEKAIEVVEAKMKINKKDKEYQGNMRALLAALHFAAGKTPNLKLGDEVIWEDKK